MDAGAYDYEQEIVLLDSVELYVTEVRDIVNEKDEKMHTLIVLASKKKWEEYDDEQQEEKEEEDE